MRLGSRDLAERRAGPGEAVGVAKTLFVIGDDVTGDWPQDEPGVARL